MTADLTVLDARAERDELVGRIDVLDKVGVLRTLPDDMHVQTAQVASFYEVEVGTIRQIVNRNREELDDDGYTVTSRSEFEGSYKMSLPSSASTVALFPRRAVLRIGMLLRDSDIARQVRDMLLSVEATSAVRYAIPTSFAEALRLAADESERADQAERELAEAKPKAELADDYLIAQGGARLVREVAKTFGMKERELRAFMIDEKLIFVRHSPCGEIQYDHYASFAHYFLPREKVVQHQWGFVLALHPDDPSPWSGVAVAAPAEVRMSLTYSLSEAADLIGGVSRDQLYQWIKQGKIPSRKLGRSWRLTRVDIDDIIAKSLRPATAGEPQVVTEFALTRRSRRSA